VPMQTELRDDEGGWGRARGVWNRRAVVPMLYAVPVRNCSCSVEPDMAVVDDMPFEMTFATASK
jgi:hypothetical protein